MASQVNPLYLSYQAIDAVHGVNKLYLDTMIVSYMRGKTSNTAVELEKLIIQPRSKLRLYYSSAHLGDFTRDETSKKDEDLKYMGSIGMTKYLAYDFKKRAPYTMYSPPINSFYRGRRTPEELKAFIKTTIKPKFDHSFLGMYDWYRSTLIEYEIDNSIINKLRPGESKAFLDLNEMIRAPSDQLTEELYIDRIDQYFKHSFTLPEKQQSKLALQHISLANDLVNYDNQAFDLTAPNLIDQLMNTKLKADLRYLFANGMSERGEDMHENYDEGTLFTNSYNLFQFLRIEPDTSSKYNLRSTMEDSTHCYFGSMCNYLVTEDKGLYKRAKIFYGVMEITTKVFTMAEFIDYMSATGH